MATSYADAVAALYQASHEEFVAERKRLSAELKASGDKTGAQRLARLVRPPVSAWAVNQLYWRARDAFDEMLETARRVREGDLGATAAHRDTMGKLRAHASRILAEAGHSANESTLRRVTATLSALAATGSFDPDPPGALPADRDPPGFGTAITTVPDDRAQTQVVEQEPVDARALAEAAERRRIEEERARRRADRERLESLLAAAQRDVEARTRGLERLRRELGDREQELERARAVALDLRARVDALGASD
jgi:hypothetical protein